MKTPNGSLLPHAYAMLTLGVATLLWPRMGPTLFCLLTILLSFMAGKVQANSRRLDRLEQIVAAASKTDLAPQATNIPSGVRGGVPKTSGAPDVAIG